MKASGHSLVVSLLAVLVFASPCRAAAPSEWLAYPKGFEYTSEWLSCVVKPSGEITAVKARDVLLVQDLFLHGTYKPKDRHDARFFQQAAEQAGSLEVRKLEEGRYAVAKSGVLRNKRYAEAAKYSQHVTLSPDRMEFRYEVETLVPLSSNTKIFLTLLTLPMATYANRGYRLRKGEGGGSLNVFPEAYDKRSDIRAGGVTELRVVLDKGHFVLETGDNTVISLSDTRGWGGKGLRADVHAFIPWRQKPVTYPAGTKFAWSFRLVFDHEK
ncbi:MAG: hypothetical protein GXP31_04415 [Kiritimatiellaeota bacterium]|nr:hypothetical protein [Kiritimatiellota bacterium]